MDVPDVLLPYLGERDPGTGIYRTYGDQEKYAEWFDAISTHIGPTVSPGGAANRVHVSRAAVHKRMNAGKLRAFMFYAPENNRDLPPYLRLFRTPTTPYVYIPWEDCVAWQEERVQRGTASQDLPGPNDDRQVSAQLKAPEAIEKQLKRIRKAGGGRNG